MRAGTHLLNEILRRNLNLDNAHQGNLDLNSIDIDKINFMFGGPGPDVYGTHWESFVKLSIGQVNRLNNIIENRGIHVIYLHRLNFVDQLLSRIILMHSPNAEINKKVYIKKAEVDASYRLLKGIHNCNNPDNIPLTIHTKITYEDILNNNVYIDNNHMNTDLNLYNLNTKKNPHPKSIIRNYDTVLKWINEFSEKYDDNWIPYLVWCQDGS